MDGPPKRMAPVHTSVTTQTQQESVFVPGQFMDRVMELQRVRGREITAPTDKIIPCYDDKRHQNQQHETNDERNHNLRKRARKSQCGKRISPKIGG